MKKDFDLEFRPHHVLGFIILESRPEWYYKPDNEFINEFRKTKGNFHSDELILYWRDTTKKIHENPQLRIKYVLGLDSICENCDKKRLCSSKEHWAYQSVQKADNDALRDLPELEIGKIYTSNYLKGLSKKINQWSRHQYQNTS